MIRRSLLGNNLDELVESGKAKQPDWFIEYYLSDDKQEEIIKSVLEEYNLSSWEKRKIWETIFLGCAPNGCKETWKEVIA